MTSTLFRRPTGCRRLSPPETRQLSAPLSTSERSAVFDRGGSRLVSLATDLSSVRRWAPRLSRAAYTWSHSIGNVELDNSSGSFNQQAITDQNDPGLDKGNTNIHRPNIFVLSDVYYLPKLESKPKVVPGSLRVAGRQNSIFTAAHGSALTVFANGKPGEFYWRTQRFPPTA